jgi:hypothetical protein
MNEEAKRERNALIRRVDELAQRHQQVQVQDEVPLLTEIVDPVVPAAPAISAQELEGIAARLERTVLAQLMPEVDRAFAAAHADLKAEIAVSVRRAVREALAPLAK